MNNGDLKFRISTPDDAGQLQTLVQSAFRAEDSRPDWTADMKLGLSFRIELEQIMNQIIRADSAILMAIDNSSSVVASIEVFKRSDDLARLSMLAVDPRHQRGGLGRQVLAHAEDYCQRTWGVQKLGLNALSTRRELILWYIRRGYRKTGELTPFPKEPLKELGLPDDLFFVELEKDLNTVPVAAGAV